MQLNLFGVVHTVHVHKPPITKEAFLEMRKKDPKAGAYHGLMWAGVFFPETQPEPVAVFGSVDGRSGRPDGAPLNDSVMFAIMLMLAARLGASKTLPTTERNYAKLVVEQAKAIGTTVSTNNLPTRGKQDPNKN